MITNIPTNRGDCLANLSKGGLQQICETINRLPDELKKVLHLNKQMQRIEDLQDFAKTLAGLSKKFSSARDSAISLPAWRAAEDLLAFVSFSLKPTADSSMLLLAIKEIPSLFKDHLSDLQSILLENPTAIKSNSNSELDRIKVAASVPKRPIFPEVIKTKPLHKILREKFKDCCTRMIAILKEGLSLFFKKPEGEQSKELAPGGLFSKLLIELFASFVSERSVSSRLQSKGKSTFGNSSLFCTVNMTSNRMLNVDLGILESPFGNMLMINQWPEHLRNIYFKPENLCVDSNLDTLITQNMMEHNLEPSAPVKKRPKQELTMLLKDVYTDSDGNIMLPCEMGKAVTAAIILYEDKQGKSTIKPIVSAKNGLFGVSILEDTAWHKKLPGNSELLIIYRERDYQTDYTELREKLLAEHKRFSYPLNSDDLAFLAAIPDDIPEEHQIVQILSLAEDLRYTQDPKIVNFINNPQEESAVKFAHLKAGSCGSFAHYCGALLEEKGFPVIYLSGYKPDLAKSDTFVDIPEDHLHVEILILTKEHPIVFNPTAASSTRCHSNPHTNPFKIYQHSLIKGCSIFESLQMVYEKAFYQTNITPKSLDLETLFPYGINCSYSKENYPIFSYIWKRRVHIIKKLNTILSSDNDSRYEEAFVLIQSFTNKDLFDSNSVIYSKEHFGFNPIQLTLELMNLMIESGIKFQNKLSLPSSLIKTMLLSEELDYTKAYLKTFKELCRDDDLDDLHINIISACCQQFLESEEDIKLLHRVAALGTYALRELAKTEREETPRIRFVTSNHEFLFHFTFQVCIFADKRSATFRKYLPEIDRALAGIHQTSATSFGFFANYFEYNKTKFIANSLSSYGDARVGILNNIKFQSIAFVLSDIHWVLESGNLDDYLDMLESLRMKCELSSEQVDKILANFQTEIQQAGISHEATDNYSIILKFLSATPGAQLYRYCRKLLMNKGEDLNVLAKYFHVSPPTNSEFQQWLNNLLDNTSVIQISPGRILLKTAENEQGLLLFRTDSLSESTIENCALASDFLLGELFKGSDRQKPNGYKYTLEYHGELEEDKRTSSSNSLLKSLEYAVYFAQTFKQKIRSKEMALAIKAACQTEEADALPENSSIFLKIAANFLLKACSELEMNHFSRMYTYFDSRNVFLEKLSPEQLHRKLVQAEFADEDQSNLIDQLILEAGRLASRFRKVNRFKSVSLLTQTNNPSGEFSTAVPREIVPYHPDMHTPRDILWKKSDLYPSGRIFAINRERESPQAKEKYIFDIAWLFDYDERLMPNLTNLLAKLFLDQSRNSLPDIIFQFQGVEVGFFSDKQSLRCNNPNEVFYYGFKNFLALAERAYQKSMGTLISHRAFPQEDSLRISEYVAAFRPKDFRPNGSKKDFLNTYCW